MSELLETVLVPLASPEDARSTCRALEGYDVGRVIAVHVIEKAGGAADKASVEQREEYAAEIFDVVTGELAGRDDIEIETEIRYGTDVPETIFAAAADHDASAIVITPRGGSRWLRMLTGDVALSLVTDTDRPVVVLPDADEQQEGGAGGDE